jgi:hypothetical protein
MLPLEVVDTVAASQYSSYISIARRQSERILVGSNTDGSIQWQLGSGSVSPSAAGSRRQWHGVSGHCTALDYKFCDFLAILLLMVGLFFI